MSLLSYLRSIFTKRLSVNRDLSVLQRAIKNARKYSPPDINSSSKPLIPNKQAIKATGSSSINNNNNSIYGLQFECGTNRGSIPLNSDPEPLSVSNRFDDLRDLSQQPCSSVMAANIIPPAKKQRKRSKSKQSQSKSRPKLMLHLLLVLPLILRTLLNALCAVPALLDLISSDTCVHSSCDIPNVSNVPSVPTNV